MDMVLLSRIQFAVTIGFHYFYPPLSIGLGLVLVLMEGLYLRTRNPLYHQLTRFWVRIFGLIFAFGVGTGIVMEFEFGTNWSRYARFVGDIFGSPLAAEGIFAFFLESGFLAVLLFGWERVSPRLHFFSTVMVCLGAHFSAIWIIVANSWMQTPTAYRIVETAVGPRAEITSFWGAVLNPSTGDRLVHTLLGAWQAGAFFVISVAAYYLLKRRHEAFARASIRVALAVAAVASLGQLVSGHSNAVMVAEHQPAKLAAFEGIYETGASADLTIVGWVDEENRTVRGIKIPGLLSWLVGGGTDTVIRGLDEWPASDRPPVQLTFQSYHWMVAIGMVLIALAWGGALLAWRGQLFRWRWLLWIYVLAVLLPQAANQLGWAAAEVGRQPWIVYELMRTADATSDTVTAGQVLFSLILFTVIYLALFVVFIVLLDQKVRKGPLPEDLPPVAEVR
ncbi:MAG TPA: cytochrome ubiquinol oxidase subunit I [Candidatus Krumholzibacteria bacterium]|nr:cytochrome ubiquinol oxidase subunit I [Candidatus Krumholzibacteria bacterium]HPD72204.1 cytochrome ubiquinol oxidase subunit I [Candidatus Krumholzibacteria bacterium]HRY40864.1 cytochrome ubiquinol oxidase subunit I [Candidatus Krumholzibacteria bacterium]